jgi:hypothetical protein
METIAKEQLRARALVAGAASRTPDLLIRMADRVSRGWLARSGNPYLGEIDEVARILGRPGAHFLNIHYEWGCTTGVKPGPGGRSARLVRVLDWNMPGLGRHVIAARVSGPAGPFVTLTWPGFAGVLQAMAPGRFAAAINQAPMDAPVGVYAADWAVNRTKVWRRHALPPAHLLRRALEEARSYAEAKDMLARSPLCVSAIFTLAGLSAGEGAIIERRENDARVHEGHVCAANHWHAPDWSGRDRGLESVERAAMLRGIAGDVASGLGWLKAPLLNARTRLLLVADAAEGQLLAQGYEKDGPATAVLSRCLQRPLSAAR